MTSRKHTQKIQRYTDVVIILTAVENLLFKIFAFLGCYAAPISFPETSWNNHQSAPHNVSEERRSHLHRCESLKSHILLIATDINVPPTYFFCYLV